MVTTILLAIKTTWGAALVRAYWTGTAGCVFTKSMGICFIRISESRKLFLLERGVYGVCKVTSWTAHTAVVAFVFCFSGCLVSY